MRHVCRYKFKHSKSGTLITDDRLETAKELIKLRFPHYILVNFVLIN